MMTSGTMHMGGHMAGAARPGSCAAYLHADAGNHAPEQASVHTRKWFVAIQPVSGVFATDRLPRPLERSP